MSEIPEGSMPDCGYANCPRAVVIWKDGKRLISHEGDYQPFDSYVRVVLGEVLSDLDEIKQLLAANAGLCGKCGRALVRSCDMCDASGLVP